MNLEKNKPETTEEQTNTETTEAEKKVEDKVGEETTPEGKLDKPLEDKTSDNDIKGDTLSPENEELTAARESTKVLIKENAHLHIELGETQDKLNILTKKVELLENCVLKSKLELALETFTYFKGDILKFKRSFPNFFVENEFGAIQPEKKEERIPYTTASIK